MNWDIIEAFGVTLIEQMMTGDLNGWEAKRKFEAFCRDMDKTTEIIYKEKLK